MAPACHVSRRSDSGASALLALRGGRRALALWARRVGRGLTVSSRQRRCAHSSPRGSVPVVLVGGSLTHREDARGVPPGPGRHSGRPKASAPPAERAGGPTRPALRSPASGQPDVPQGRVGNPPRGLHGDGPQKTTWGVAPTRKDGLACLRKLESTFLSQAGSVPSLSHLLVTLTNALNQI